MPRKPDARSFGQDLMRGEHIVGAIPGGGTGANSAYLFKTASGYAAGAEAQDEGTGTSIFDPVLCEIAYRWFCPPGGQVLDPFAGGSVRGIVAAKLGRPYLGVDLSARQVAANGDQAERICTVGEPRPEWRCGDSAELATLCAGAPADFVFSCPPYADLERYSDDPRDLSTLPYDAFQAAYAGIIAAAVALLRPDRFACFVVGEVRDKKGCYRGFVPDTVRAFESAGARFYNEAILITPSGSLAVRVGRQFLAGRKLGKSHQNVLVFCKGDSKRAAALCEGASG